MLLLGSDIGTCSDWGGVCCTATFLRHSTIACWARCEHDRWGGRERERESRADVLASELGTDPPWMTSCLRSGQLASTTSRSRVFALARVLWCVRAQSCAADSLHVIQTDCQSWQSVKKLKNHHRICRSRWGHKQKVPSKVTRSAHRSTACRSSSRWLTSVCPHSTLLHPLLHVFAPCTQRSLSGCGCCEWCCDEAVLLHAACWSQDCTVCVCREYLQRRRHTIQCKRQFGNTVRWLIAVHPTGACSVFRFPPWTERRLWSCAWRR